MEEEYKTIETAREIFENDTPTLQFRVPDHFKLTQSADPTQFDTVCYNGKMSVITKELVIQALDHGTKEEAQILQALYWKNLFRQKRERKRARASENQQHLIA